MNLLPHWVLTDKFPAFYDSESKTAIEQTARLYGAMQELITEYNKFVDSINLQITNFINDSNEDYELFQIGLRQEFQDFIDIVELKMKSQDAKIDEVINYLTTNLKAAISELIEEMKDSGELAESILVAFDDLKKDIYYVTPRMYGAVGDGVADDTLAIQTAVNDVISNGGGTIIFPVGTYLITETIKIEGNGYINICGEGLESTKINKTGNGDAFQVTAKYRVVFKNLYIRNAGASGHAINFYSGESHEIDHCTVSNLSTVNTDSAVYFTGSNTFLKHSTFSAVDSQTYAVICTNNPNSFTNINSRIYDCHFANSGSGLLVTSNSEDSRCEGLKVSRNVFLNTGNVQIKIQSILDCDIVDNMMDQGFQNTILINPFGLGVSGIRILNNYISPTGNKEQSVGIYILGGSSITLVANHIRYCAYGINISAAAQNINISDNIFNAIGNTAITSKCPMTIIKGNSFTDVTYSLDLNDSSGGNFIVIGNDFANGSKALNISQNENLILYGNNNLPDLAFASVTITANETGVKYGNIMLPAGVKAKPGGILLTAITADSGGVNIDQLAVAAITDTYITVRCNVVNTPSTTATFIVNALIKNSFGE